MVLGPAVEVVVVRGGRLANDGAVGAGFVRSPGALCVETVVILFITSRHLLGCWPRLVAGSDRAP